MNNQLIESADTLNAVKDTVATVASPTDLPSLSFNLNNITTDSLVLTVLGYTIVFLALLFLFVTFVNIAKVLNFNLQRKLKEEESETMSGEVTAAISMALMIHFREVHDFENTVITIKKVQKPYSPWSSKIYGLRQYPEKR